MSSVQSLPTCNKIASAGLMNSCSELDRTASSKSGLSLDDMLEQSKSIYAARLAICELSDAFAPIPKECTAFAPTKSSYFLRSILPGRRPEYPTYDAETAKHLNRCLKSLSRFPQSWTSYSNAKQNAVIMCRAMRASIERGK